jgi:hypothetical protein
MQNKFISALKLMFRNANVFFRNQQWKEILIFLFFLLLAFIFWLLENLQQDYEQRVELPLHYKNVPPEWILSEDNPAKISVLLKDKGTTLMYFLWGSYFSPINISVSNLSHAPGQTLHMTAQELETIISKQLISSPSIVSIEPHEITIKYDSLSSRSVPVIANVIVNAKPGFQVSGDIKISHPEIRLYGSRKVLDPLNGIRTKLYTIENASATRELIAELDLPVGVKTNRRTVQLTVPVEEFTEKKIHLPVLCYNIPSGYALRIFPSTVEVACNIPLSLFKELDEEDIKIRLSFDEFEENRLTGKLPVRLTEKPSWVANAVIVPGEVEFIIEQLHHD